MPTQKNIDAQKERTKDALGEEDDASSKYAKAVLIVASVASMIGQFNMPNIKSAKKRILVAETRAARNKAIRSKVKTFIKKVDAAIVAGDKAAAQACLVNAISEIDKACTKGVYHKNNASRKISRLSKAVNAMN